MISILCSRSTTFVIRTTVRLFLPSCCDSETLPLIPSASHSKLILSSISWDPVLFGTMFSPAQQFPKKLLFVTTWGKTNCHTSTRSTPFIFWRIVATIKSFQPAYGTSIKCLYTPIQTVCICIVGACVNDTNCIFFCLGRLLVPTWTTLLHC